MTIASIDYPHLDQLFLSAKKKSSPIIFPTDTIYGIGAMLSDIQAQKKIYQIKSRDQSMPFPIIVSTVSMARSLAEIDDISTNCKQLLFPVWQPYTTFIFKAREDVHPIYVKDKKIAIRLSNSVLLSGIINNIGEPITATSVNKSSNQALNIFSDILKNYINSVDFFIYGKNNHNSRDNPSNIIDLTYPIPEKIR